MLFDNGMLFSYSLPHMTTRMVHPTTRTALGPFFSEGARQVWLQVVMKGTSQEEIRRAIGLGRGMVNRYLYGDRRVSLDVAVRIESAFGIAPKLWLAPPAKKFRPPTLIHIPAARKSRTAA
jgi:hypothetical protein